MKFLILLLLSFSLFSCCSNNMDNEEDENVVEGEVIYINVDGRREVAVYEYDRDGNTYLIFDEWRGEGMQVINITKEELEMDLMREQKLNIKY